MDCLWRELLNRFRLRGIVMVLWELQWGCTLTDMHVSCQFVLEMTFCEISQTVIKLRRVQTWENLNTHFYLHMKVSYIHIHTLILSGLDHLSSTHLPFLTATTCHYNWKPYLSPSDLIGAIAKLYISLIFFQFSCYLNDACVIYVIWGGYFFLENMFTRM